MQALSIQGLIKTYRNGVRALRGVDLDVAPGDFFALLGPNGAGKTTLIGIVTSLVNKTAGRISVFGHDMDREMAAAKACLGVVPQEINLNQFDRVQNILVNQAGFYGIPPRLARARAQEALEQLQLWERRREIARNLSGGMKRRLMIARALVHHPRLLILDEPTAGVDIEIRRSMWRFLEDINAAGTTIILTTHYLEEAENLCRNVAIIDRGRIVEHDRLQSVLRKLHQQVFILNTAEPLAALPPLDGYRATRLGEQEIEIEVRAGQDLNTAFERLSDAGIRVISMRNKANRLEEVFFHLTDRSLDEQLEAAHRQ